MPPLHTPRPRIAPAGHTARGIGARGRPSPTPPAASRSDADALRALSAPFRPQRGADYGEGFVSFRREGGPRRLDVDELNRVYSPRGALRLRYAARPDEALAALFDAEVLFDLHAARRAAWEGVAVGRGVPLPDTVAAAAASAAARLHPVDAALAAGLADTRDDAHAVAVQVAHAYSDHVANHLSSPRPGVRRFLSALAAAGCAVAAVAAVDAPTLRSALRRSGLDALAPASASLDDGDAVAQRLLAAALRLGRAPASCVAFVADAPGVAAAHNASMRAVGVAAAPHAGGGAARHELARADATVGRVDELAVYNLRRLFANVGSEGGAFMDLAKEKDGEGPGRWEARPRGVAGGLA